MSASVPDHGRPEATGVDLGGLGLDGGGSLLLKHALHGAAPGSRIEVRGSHPDLQIHLRAWCRVRGLQGEFPADGGVCVVIAAGPALERTTGAERAGNSDRSVAGAVAEFASPRWGLAARGALVEAGAPEFRFPLHERDLVWADEAAALYAQAAAAQWDPASAVDWSAPFELPDEVEDAVVQVMTFLIENETAALIVPARFLAQVHPHFREVQQVLAIQSADEARHIEIFTRRAMLRRTALGLSTAGGQASLQTLVEETDFALASFLLSVLGEGSFLSLLWFLHEHGPDPVTRQVARLAAQDEARHVAFGVAHLRRHLRVEPGLRDRLRAAVERRHDALRHTTGLNEEVFDALVLLAAGDWEPSSIASGHARVLGMLREMDRGRRGLLGKLGFEAAEAATLSGLHTRNFM